MKDFLINALAAAILGIALMAAIWYGTSAEVWYAGEHTHGCNGTDNCGCYERLVNGDNK